ncbi:hypothetical protein COBT_002711, partial [Conglomerata obtusa]
MKAIMYEAKLKKKEDIELKKLRWEKSSDDLRKRLIAAGEEEREWTEIIKELEEEEKVAIKEEEALRFGKMERELMKLKDELEKKRKKM